MILLRSCRGSQRPEYTAEVKNDDDEIRLYGETIVAQTIVESNS